MFKMTQKRAGRLTIENMSCARKCNMLVDIQSLHEPGTRLWKTSTDTVRNLSIHFGIDMDKRCWFYDERGQKWYTYYAGLRQLNTLSINLAQRSLLTTYVSNLAIVEE